jgi:hypothetical protein
MAIVELGTSTMTRQQRISAHLQRVLCILLQITIRAVQRTPAQPHLFQLDML